MSTLLRSNLGENSSLTVSNLLIFQFLRTTTSESFIDASLLRLQYVYCMQLVVDYSVLRSFW
jgi:hypothetical protein